jgi:uncharacterized protein (DUF1697 family)
VPKFAAFLRAINLGKNRRVSGAELRSLFEGLGLQEVATFRTSGNVVFSTDRKAKLGERIEAGLAEELGYDVGVFLRTEDELLAIAAHEPFAPELVEASKGKLQVALLGKEPSKQARETVLGLSTEDDRLTFGDRELYWLPRGGTQESALDAKVLDQQLGAITLRTKGTIEQLAAKYFGG